MNVEEYRAIKDLIEADKEFEKGGGVSFFSLKELDEYLDNC